MSVTKQRKAMNLDRTLDFHINLTTEKGIIYIVSSTTMKGDLIENNPKQVNDHTLSSGAKRDSAQE